MILHLVFSSFMNAFNGATVKLSRRNRQAASIHTISTRLQAGPADGISAFVNEPWTLWSWGCSTVSRNFQIFLFTRIIRMVFSSGRRLPVGRSLISTLTVRPQFVQGCSMAVQDLVFAREIIRQWIASR
ncbi:hypothetical protein N018_19785 [Pseudomonas syringae CC1557]|uniref:Uncharacterized protein n=1 Tax=Pseudomonas syringae CC1557 TaxID=1357279 RepID=W0N2Z2_PSESX|nr:hypothetical protein N018_19785 [Pseudomonas syringae CC1557]